MTIVFCNRRRETTIGIDRGRESAVRGMKTERAKSPEERSVSPETIDSARSTIAPGRMERERGESDL